MKKIRIALGLMFCILALSLTLFGQGPPSPPVNPGDGGGPVGGNAALGSGIGVMLVLGTAFALKKVCSYLKKDDCSAGVEIEE